MQKHDVSVLIPMLGREWHIEPLLESLYATSPSAEALFLISPHDAAVHSKVAELGERMIVVPRVGKLGDYARKINVGYRNTTSDLIFLGASDLLFHPNWLENASEMLSGSVHVVGTNDLGNPRVIRGLHATHSLLTREYAGMGLADGRGGILYEGYQHEYVDDEFVETAKCRGMWGFAKHSVVEHLHPAYKKGNWDKSYKEAKGRLAKGYEVYLRRRHLWTQLS